MTSSGVVVFCVMTVLRAPGWLLMLLAVVVVLVSVVAAGDAASRILVWHRDSRKLPAALRGLLSPGRASGNRSVIGTWAQSVRIVPGDGVGHLSVEPSGAR